MVLKDIKLGECLSMIENGATIKQKEGAGGYPITRIETLSNDRFNRDRLGYADINNIELFKNHILDDEDLIMSHINSRQFLGRTVIYLKKGSETIIHGMNVLRIKTKRDLLNPYYAYYYFKTPHFRKAIDNIRTDAINQSSINTNNIKDIKIHIPDLVSQEKVVGILRGLDKKIEENEVMNAELEAMAKQLYDYWFVQFDFPDENGNPYKSSGGKMVYNPTLKREIPAGWEVKNLFYIAKYYNGLACQNYRPSEGEDSLPVIKITEMHNGFTSETERASVNIPAEAIIENGDVLFAWSASLEVMLWGLGKGALNQHIFKVTSNNGFPKSYYYYQLLEYVGHFKKIAEAKKTTMGHITKDHLEQSQIVVPPTTDLPNQLEEKLEPIMDKIVSLSSERIYLTHLRDSLLPMLMNGQVTVE